MNEKLNNFKKSMRMDPTELLALSVTVVALVGVVAYHKYSKTHFQFTINMEEAKALQTGNENLLFETSIGDFVLRSLTRPEN